MVRDLAMRRMSQSYLFVDRFEVTLQIGSWTIVFAIVDRDR